MIVILTRVLAARLPLTIAILEGAQTTVRNSVRVVALWMVLSGIASAHSFTAGVLVAGEERVASLAEAVRGFLLAADERDGHPNETSDGHLGGIDVQVLPLPNGAARLFAGLIGTPTEPGDVVVVLGAEPAASEAAREYKLTSTVLLQVVLPVGWDGDERTDSFVARYRLAYGTEPGVMAATGYQAGRRLDVTIRLLDGVVPRAALEDAWRSTDSGLTW